MTTINLLVAIPGASGTIALKSRIDTGCPEVPYLDLRIRGTAVSSVGDTDAPSSQSQDSGTDGTMACCQHTRDAAAEEGSSAETPDTLNWIDEDPDVDRLVGGLLARERPSPLDLTRTWIALVESTQATLDKKSANRPQLCTTHHYIQWHNALADRADALADRFRAQHKDELARAAEEIATRHRRAAQPIAPTLSGSVNGPSDRSTID